eukprot:350255-Chlamydomonas_euryale.AAC.45
MGSPEWRQKVDELYKSIAGQEGARWARPEEPILHDLADEKGEPHVFFHNTNYRISRKYINVEKVKASCIMVLLGVDSAMSIMHLKVFVARFGIVASLPELAVCIFLVADSEAAVTGMRSVDGQRSVPQMSGGERPVLTVACLHPAVSQIYKRFQAMVRVSVGMRVWADSQRMAARGIEGRPNWPCSSQHALHVSTCAGARMLLYMASPSMEPYTCGYARPRNICCESCHTHMHIAHVASNVDRGPLARKRDVGFIYHTNKMKELQKQAAELEVEFPFKKY